MEKIRGSYSIHAGNYDWGCAVDKAVITLETAIGKIDSFCLKIRERKMVTEEGTPEFDIHEELIPRVIKDAYLCDKTGDKVSTPSRHFAVELEVGPVTGSPLVCHGKCGIFRWSDPYQLLIEGPDLDIDPDYTERRTAADMFEKAEYRSTDGVTYQIATYTPEEKTDKLLVWLHGLGEGQAKDSDAYLPLVGHKGTTLAHEFQEVMEGAHILVPQCPTYWMDTDGTADNFSEGRIHADNTSFYTESLEELIDTYADQVGAKKIMLAGCSNGGFMSVLLAAHRPERYCLAVPICEAVADADVTEEQITSLTKIPLYFIYCRKDPVVDPTLHEIPTIKRLKETGHESLMVYESSKVVDTTGNYLQKDGSPHEYMSHLSWIHFDNNEDENGKPLGVWEWMKEQAEK